MGIGIIREIADSSTICLTRKIAEGGMSVVYEGELRGCEGFRKKVAVKMLRPQWTSEKHFMDLFLDEARLVSDLVHENIVQIYQLNNAGDSEYYIVMELVNGLPLHDFIGYHRENKLHVPEPLAVHIASRIARGLAYAHEFTDREGCPLRIVHRDVCPRNILITTEGLSKLTDFGIAKALNNTVIGDGWLTGKVRYMSPEQAACQQLTPLTDIYSLGAVLFETLSGVSIRPGTADPDKGDFAMHEIQWNVLPNDTGEELVAILRRMLQSDPAKRFQSATDVARALEEYIYRDGYGPTINTVEGYMRLHFPYLYLYGDNQCPPSFCTDDTVIMPDED